MRRRKSIKLLAACCTLAAAWDAAPLAAEENAQSAAVRAAAVAYLAALDRGDETAIAAAWTEDGVYVDASGTSHKARELAHKEFTSADSKPRREESSREESSPTPSTIHLVSPTVAIEQSTPGTVAVDGAQSQALQFVAIWVKPNDRWQLSLLREFPPASRAPTANGLDQLAWMVGKWTATQGQTVVELTAEWTPDRTFLIQQFVAKRDDGLVRRGSQRIAWDAAAKRLRSWTFHADGGFSEASWQPAGDVWIAESTGVLPDGRRASSTQFWTPEGDEACWFKSLAGKIDGQPADDLILKFSRREATP